VVIVPETFELIATVPVVPPFFLMENEEGSIVTEQPPLPPPVKGGPEPTGTPLQSAVLLWIVDPLTTALLTMSDVVLTVAGLTVGKTVTSLLTVTSPESETSTHVCWPPLFVIAKLVVHDEVRPRQLKVMFGSGVKGGFVRVTPGSNA